MTPPHPKNLLLANGSGLSVISLPKWPPRGTNNRKTLFTRGSDDRKTLSHWECDGCQKWRCPAKGQEMTNTDDIFENTSNITNVQIQYEPPPPPSQIPRVSTHISSSLSGKTLDYPTCFRAGTAWCIMCSTVLDRA